MPQASVSSAHHDLAGPSGAVDDVVRFAAEYLTIAWARPRPFVAGHHPPLFSAGLRRLHLRPPARGD